MHPPPRWIARKMRRNERKRPLGAARGEVEHRSSPVGGARAKRVALGHYTKHARPRRIKLPRSRKVTGTSFQRLDLR